MSDVALTAAQISPVNETQYTAKTGMAGEAITIGQAVAVDTTTGKIYLADGSTAARNNVRGIALNNAGAGYPVTYLMEGSIYGFTLTALDYDAVLYLSNTAGALGTTAGDVSVV